MCGANSEDTGERLGGALLSPMYGANQMPDPTYEAIRLLSPMYGANHQRSKH